MKCNFDQERGGYVKTLGWFLVCYWLIMLGLLIVGVKPDYFIVGCAFLISAINSVPTEK
jgi:energy-converting hydrogenase Eha subunit B